jgi:hypothetical protein
MELRKLFTFVSVDTVTLRWLALGKIKEGIARKLDISAHIVTELRDVRKPIMAGNVYSLMWHNAASISSKLSVWVRKPITGGR